MHTPTLIQTAFTAAALFGAAQAAPVRRGSVVEDNFVPSGPPSRRGSIATDEVVSSRRSSIVDPMLGAPPSRRGSLAGDLPSPGSRRRSVAAGADDVPVSPLSRRASLAATPADIVNARRRSMADEALPNLRRSSGASVADIAASRRRSAIDEAQQPVRRSSLAVPTADALGSRRRSFAAGDSVPFRRSSLAVEAIPTRKAFIPEQYEEGHNDEDSQSATFASEVKMAAGNPANLPNRKAYIPSHAVSSKEAEVKLASFELPNRKAYVFPEALAPDAGSTTPQIKQVHPGSLPNRKAYVFPEVNVSDEDALPHQPAIKQVHPATLPNRKAFIFPEASGSNTDAQIKNAQIKNVNPFAVPNRKAFITPEDAGITHTEDLAPEEEDYSPAATPIAVKNVHPFSLPNRKAFVSPESAGVARNEDVAPEDTVVAEPEQIAEAGQQADSKSATGTAIPLRKRQINPLATAGVLNWDAAEVSYPARTGLEENSKLTSLLQAHLNHIDIKYEKGAIAYQTQTGEALFGSKLFTPDELYERETRLARRAAAMDALEQNVPQDVSEDEDLQTIDEAFAAMSTEFAVGNPKSQMLRDARAGASKRAGVQLQAQSSDLRRSGLVIAGAHQG